MICVVKNLKHVLECSLEFKMFQNVLRNSKMFQMLLFTILKVIYVKKAIKFTFRMVPGFCSYI